MRPVAQRAIALMLLLGLSSCTYINGEKSYFRDRTDDYRKARATAVLEVPAGLDDEALQDIYVIPPITEDISVNGEFNAPRPAPLVTGSVDQLVRIQKLADEQWMLVSVAPGQLWPQVRSYLGGVNMPIARVEASAGLIETAWVEPEGAIGERYRFRIEQGVQRNTSELHILQMGMVGDINTWPTNSTDAAREDDMLRSMAQFIADSVGTAPVSMMAQQAISASGRVSMQEDDDGNPYIRLDLPYHRAWASVDRALGEANFDILDRDRSAGAYFVHYNRPLEEDSGWLDWLFSNDEDDPAAELEKYDYRVELNDLGGETVHIEISRKDGGELSQSHAQSILSLIKGNIT
ncbi:outer membrane protein assembly factor BamC [Halieaceae bacterium IMCC14734]|uniref:Outer membrane protein assembly factor BamC n=1 Tax=Candidatus Litorirhabdus singularis TaxID=2518993 RepID=A0ABT3TIS1_9GAMM|nr:outer membrane protein assembly factor BamC [Candidatus Litorirhabdus singularis]MCX2982164.1 outer membrane protein assembly factor BamC [Candidatus Litorirhabdus singularis]